jgi:hypothetical protein
MMDYYNVNWRSYTHSLYTKWNALYSPVNIYLARLLTPVRCLESKTAFELRMCDDIGGAYFMLTCIFINATLIFKILGKTPYRGLWTTLMTTSFPMLYALERGNYIFLGMATMSLYVLSKGTFAKILAMIFAIAAKFYLILLMAPFYFRYGTKKILIAISGVFIIFSVFGYFINNQEWLYIPYNVFHFGYAHSPFWLESSASPTAIKAYNMVAKNLLSDKEILLTDLLAWFTTLITFLLVVKIWQSIRLGYDYYKQEEKFLVLITLAALMITSTSPSYYSLILLFPFFAYGLEKRILSNSAKFFFILLLLPYPMKLTDIFSTHMNAFYQNSDKIFITISLTLQSLMPPILLFLFLTATINSINQNIQSKQ